MFKIYSVVNSMKKKLSMHEEFTVVVHNYKAAAKKCFISKTLRIICKCNFACIRENFKATPNIFFARFIPYQIHTRKIHSAKAGMHLQNSSKLALVYFNSKRHVTDLYIPFVMENFAAQLRLFDFYLSAKLCSGA